LSDALTEVAKREIMDGALWRLQIGTVMSITQVQTEMSDLCLAIAV